MQVDIHSGPSFALGEITLPPGGAVRVEAGAMAMTRGDVAMKTSTRGGFMKGLRRSLGWGELLRQRLQPPSAGAWSVWPRSSPGT